MTIPSNSNLHKTCMALSAFKSNLLSQSLKFQVSDLQAVLRLQRDLKDLRVVMTRLALGKDLDEAGVVDYLNRHPQDWVSETPAIEENADSVAAIVDYDGKTTIRMGGSGRGPGMGNRLSVYIGSQIIAWRRKLSISRVALQMASKVGTITLEKLECGFNNSPRLSTLQDLAESLGVLAVVEFIDHDEFDRRYEALRKQLSPPATETLTACDEAIV